MASSSFDYKDRPDGSEYIRKIAKRAFRNIVSLDDRAIKKIEKNLDEIKPLKTSRFKFTGVYLGTVVGVIICISAYLMGIPLSNVENIFITVQFALLGGLISYINS